MGQSRHNVTHTSVYLVIYTCTVVTYKKQGTCSSSLYFHIHLFLHFISFLNFLFCYFSVYFFLFLFLSISSFFLFSYFYVFIFIYFLTISFLQVRVCLGHYASAGLKDPLRGRDSNKLVGIEITDYATIRYRREKVN